MSKLRKALERAKEVRGAGSQGVVSLDKSPGLNSRQQARMKVEDRCPVSVTYCKTKVLDVDPQMLKKNKIFSLSEDSPVTDQIKSLRAQVLQRLKASGGNSLLVTSANAGEGKTFTAINLGVSIAQELDRTVLLVDADLRNPTFKHYDFAGDFFGVEVERGLADYLMESLEIPDLLLNPGIKKLTILPGGRMLPNSSELLGSSRMELLVRELRSRYREDRIIIFDGPGLLVCTDPLVLSNYVDGVLLVIEEERTSYNDIKRVMELLKDKPVLGTVLNKSKG